MKKTERVALYSLLVKLCLAVFKIFLAVISSSIALLAESIHALIDIFSTGLVFIGLKVSGHKSRRFPCGLYKVENFISLVISLLIFFTGYEILIEIFRFHSEYEVRNVTAAVLSMGLISICTLVWALYEIRIAEEHYSPSLLADGKHLKIDFLLSTIVFGGLAGNFLGLKLDKPTALIMLIFVFKAGFEILKDSLKVLLDASFDFETLEKIKNIIKNNNTVKNVKALTGRSSGSYKFIEAEIEIDSKELKRAHQICGMIEESIRKELPNVEKIMIHCKPYKDKYFNLGIPMENKDNKISEHFGRAPYIFFFRINREDKKIIQKNIIENPYILNERQKGIRLAEFLADKKLDALILRENIDGKGTSYVLQSKGIELIHTEHEFLEDILSSPLSTGEFSSS